ncbi:MAG: hypothetical protein ACI9V1_000760 [Spirosomataceae bacterium]|jgi:hypothetical protein
MGKQALNNFVGCKTFLTALFVFVVTISNGQQIKAPVESREFAMTLLNLEESDPNHGLSWINEMYISGVRTIILTVRWDMVYVDSKSNADWQLFDKQMKLISQLGMKAGLRIHLGRKRLKWDGFWTDEEIMRDFKGIPSIVGYAESHFSYSSERATNKANDFIKEVCERYKSYQQSGNILFVNVSTTQDQEAGFFYRNQEPTESISYASLYDFSKPALADLQRQMEEKYENVNTLNKYWITKYTKFSQAAPYITKWNPRTSFIGKRGKDFYMARNYQLKNFLKITGDVIKSVDPNYKVCYDFGSLTDIGSDLRGTFSATSLAEHCDILKHNDERREWSFDILAHNVNKPLYNEIYPQDRYSIQDMVNLTDWYFENGSSLVTYLVASDEHARKFKQVLAQTKRWYNEPIRPIVAEKKMDIYVSQLIDNYQKVFDRWQSVSKNGTIKVAVDLKEDVLEVEKIEILPYKSPQELATLYGYYTPDDDTHQGTGNGEGVVVNPPPSPGTSDTTNSLPYALRKFTPEPLIVKESFRTSLDNDIFLDVDGYISTIELVSGPKWLTFHPEGFFFTGQPPELGKFDVRLRAYDNRGAWVEDSFIFEVVRPTINFTIIEANYFDVPIIEWASLVDKQVLYIDELPQFMNFTAECNVDSITMDFEMTGPFYKKNLSERLPFSLFGEGRGYYPPEGTYQLTASALKRDSVITTNSISFTLLANRNSDKPTEWLTYPNPFIDVCNVKVPADVDPTNISFKLVDLSGRVSNIDDSQITSVEETKYINLRKNHLQQGAYFLQAILDGEVVYQFKIFKK